MIKVLVVDDSAVVRQHLKYLYEADGTMKVCGLAVNGREAVDMASLLKPDVISMDINMPVMNGMEATRLIMETEPVPIVIVSASYQKNDVEKSFLAIEAGAVAILGKPGGDSSAIGMTTRQDLLETIKLMSEIKVVRRWSRSLATKRPAPDVAISVSRGHKIAVVAIGASTGGPPVLQTILSGLDSSFPAPVLIVQHIAKGFIRGLVDWLNQTTEMRVSVARHNERAAAGSRVYLAPDDMHLGIDGSSRLILSNAEPENGVRPSVSYLFRSAIEAFGKATAGVLLTGMGKDGADELLAMHNAGGVTIAQDRETSVVFGMPGEAVRLGAADHVLAPDLIPPVLSRIARPGPKNADS
ncbi:MAG: chemotaxis-specific protein-glutamate methyltransferase CheB [Deltaproteobacteria bacterium]